MSRFMDDLTWANMHTVDDIKVIHRIYPDATVTKNDTVGNDEGIDYFVTDRFGHTITIDVKRRRPGVSRYWADRNDPELTLETARSTGNPGFILNDTKKTDLYLFIFDETDTEQFFYIRADWLRYAFKQHQNEWEQYKHTRYHADYWSEFYCIPVSVIGKVAEDYAS